MNAAEYLHIERLAHSLCSEPTELHYIVTMRVLLEMEDRYEEFIEFKEANPLLAQVAETFSKWFPYYAAP